MAMTDSEINQYMIAALAEAKKAAAIGEVPIGAVVVHDQQIIGRGYNLRETTQDATQHAEILAIQAACRQLGTWRLEDCSLFVKLEPCPMCAGAMINARIATCYFGATDPKAGVAGTFYNLLEDTRFNHQVAVVPGIQAIASAALLQDFFRAIRAKRKAAHGVKFKWVISEQTKRERIPSC